MSYKYHERAIVFNERNLVRLWDIAYDGYNGGKDDTYVDWMDNENPKNGLKAFQAATLDLSRSYRGPSMMVMAFVHDREEMLANDGRTVFDAHFRRNWPSPIVFHDMHNPSRDPGPSNETLPLDYDNIQVLAVDDFRVFNNPTSCPLSTNCTRCARGRGNPAPTPRRTSTRWHSRAPCASKVKGCSCRRSRAADTTVLTMSASRLCALGKASSTRGRLPRSPIWSDHE